MASIFPTFFRCVFCLVVIAAVPVLPFRAHLVADGATNTLSNVTNSITGDVTVGTNGAFTMLILTNGALLTNSSNGYIGRNAGANSNTVWLTGSNSRWLLPSQPPGTLYVGSAG